MADPWAVQSVEAADPWAVAEVKPAAASPRRSAGPSARPKKGLFGDVFGAAMNAYESIPFVDEGAAALDTGLRLVTGQAKSIPDAWKQSRDLQDVNARDFKARRPTATAVIKGAAASAPIFIPGGAGANLFAQGSRVGNMARGATVAAGNAYLYGVSDKGTLAERAKAGNEAATNPFVLGLGAAGGALAPVAPRAKPKAPARHAADVATLAGEGVQLTPGQIRGGVAKTAEDAGTSLPFVGDAISERRTEGAQSFVRATLNRALKPSGERLPEDIPAGTEAIKWAGDRLSKGYENAVPSKVVRADPGFADDVRKTLSNIDTLTPDAKARLADILDQRITSRLPESGQMDGALYKQIQSELDYEVARFAKASDPDQRAIGDAISGVQQALEGAARRQDPKFAQRIDALDKGWAEIARIESAGAKSRDLSGVFTPAQYAQSIRAADGRVRNRGVARGEALSQDLAGAGVRVMPSKIGESGTSWRAAWGMLASTPGAVIGAVTGGGVGALAGIGGTGATLAGLSRLYTPEAVQAANVALNSKLATGARTKAAQDLAAMAARDPKIQRLYQEVAARLSAEAGAVGGSQASEPRNLFAQP